MAVPAGVWSGDGGAAIMIAFFAFWLSGLAEAVATPGAGVAKKIKGVSLATGAALLGLVVFSALLTVFGM
jgi:hypothetical protein